MNRRMLAALTWVLLNSAGLALPAHAASAVLPTAELGAAADLTAAVSQAQTQRKSGDIAGAVRTLSQLMLFAPDDPRVLGEYGKTMVAQGRSDDAIAFLERAVEVRPTDWTLYSAQGVAYDQKGDYKNAQLAYAKALSLQPGEPTVLSNAALSHMQAGELDAAEKLLLQAAPNAAAYPRIAQNLAMVEGLKARHAMPNPAQMAPAPVVTTVVAKQPEPKSQEDLAPYRPAAATAVASAALAPPPTSGLAALQADPTVRMASIPKDEKAGPVAQNSDKRVATAPPKSIAVAAAEPTLTPKAVPAKKIAATPKPIYVQAGAYPSEASAGKMADQLDSLGARVSMATENGHAVYRVRIGPFLDADQASPALDRARAMTKDVKLVSE